MAKRFEVVEIRLPKRTAAGVHEVAKLAGVKPETVIKVMMAVAVLTAPARLAAQQEKDPSDD